MRAAQKVEQKFKLYFKSAVVNFWRIARKSRFGSQRSRGENVFPLRKLQKSSHLWQNSKMRNYTME
jgi:hypothetical protein